MDFHSLLRRDLQFLCKKNKIPANMTNVAMADALKALEIVEGLHEYINQSDSNAPQSPTTVAKLPPSTTTRTTRRKTTTKAEPQSSSQLVSRSCRSTSKSLAGDLDQENENKNVSQELKTSNVKFEANVPKTPAARSTRKASAATSCNPKVQDTKKNELVQSVYNTRRSTRLLEKCMADLSLMGNDNDQKIRDQEISVNLGGIPVLENTETLSDDEASKSCQVDQPEKEQATQEDDAEPERINNDDNESKKVLAVNSLVQVDQQETEQTMLENYSELEKVNNFDEDNKIDIDAGDSETKPEDSDGTSSEADSNQAVLGSDLADEEITLLEPEGSAAVPNSLPLLEDVKVDQQEKEQATQEDGSEPAKINNDDNESQNALAFNSLVQVDQEEAEQTIQEIYSEPEKINNYNEDNKIDSDAGVSETKPEEGNSGVDSDGINSEADSNQAVLGSGVDSDGTSSEADSNQAVLGSDDIADKEMTLLESEGSDVVPNSPPLLEDVKVIKKTPIYPFAAESISIQFPRPNNSTIPFKNSGLKMVNVDKENNIEMMMNVNNYENGESKGEEAKKKKVTFDEAGLKDMSMRQLVKMVNKLTIKSTNRTALEVLPANNQSAE